MHPKYGESLNKGPDLKLPTRLASLLVLSIMLVITSCGGSSSSSNGSPVNEEDKGTENPDIGGGNPDPEEGATGRIFFIKPGPNATTEMLVAMISVKLKDVIEFGEGYFEPSSGLQISGNEDIVVKGQGMDKTALSLSNIVVLRKAFWQPR